MRCTRYYSPTRLVWLAAMSMMLVGCDSITAESPQPQLCGNTCEYASDGDCDDGGPGALTSACELGTDCNDCGSRIDADRTGAQIAESIAADLPDSDVTVSAVKLASAGPDDAVYGLSFGDGSQSFALGTTTDSTLDITGVVIADASGAVVLIQEYSENSTKLTSGAGDAVEFINDGASKKLLFTLNATTPPSIAIVDIDEFGVATFNEEASIIQEIPNDAYQDGTGTTDFATAKARLRSMKDSYGLSARFTCDEVSNQLVAAASDACSVRSFLTEGLPNRVVDGGCEAVSLAFGKLRGDQTDSQRFKVFTGFRIGLQVGCELVKKGIGIGALVTKANPYDIACFSLQLIDDSRQATREQSLGEAVCDAVNGIVGSDDSTDPVDSDGNAPSDSGAFTIIEYINMDGTRGTGPTAAQIQLSGPDPTNPIYSFPSIMNATTLVVVGSDASLNYSLESLDLSDPDNPTLGTLTSPIQHGDRNVPGTTLGGIVDPAPLIADGTAYVIVVASKDVDANGDALSASLQFSVNPN